MGWGEIFDIVVHFLYRFRVITFVFLAERNCETKAVSRVAHSTLPDEEMRGGKIPKFTGKQVQA